MFIQTELSFYVNDIVQADGTSSPHHLRNLR